MRQIYTSPRQENIDTVVALMAEHGIETSVANRSNYNRRSWQRFSYSQQREDRSGWAQVWITHADDYSQARKLLLELGIEPVIRHGEELAAARNPSPLDRRARVATRIRRILLLMVLVVFAVQMLRYLHVF
jgi:ferric-dicitrate binding protein FerR (iron transport regulator)